MVSSMFPDLDLGSMSTPRSGILRSPRFEFVIYALKFGFGLLHGPGFGYGLFGAPRLGSRLLHAPRVGFGLYAFKFGFGCIVFC